MTITESRLQLLCEMFDLSYSIVKDGAFLYVILKEKMYDDEILYVRMSKHTMTDLAYKVREYYIQMGRRIGEIETRYSMQRAMGLNPLSSESPYR